VEADNAVARAEDAEAKNKKYEQLLLEKDQEIGSLTHRLSTLDGELEKTEGKLAELKSAHEEGETSKSTNEGLVRKIQLLEEELDAAEKNVKETMEKCVSRRDSLIIVHCSLVDSRLDCGRLTSRPSTLNVNYNAPNRSAINGRRSTRYVKVSKC
jgi:chromosome segregation ATPase